MQIAATRPKPSPLEPVVDLLPLLLPPDESDVQSGDRVTLNRSFPAAGVNNTMIDLGIKSGNGGR